MVTIADNHLCVFRGLMQTLYMSWNGLGWTVAPQFKLADLDDRIKEARLIGPYVSSDFMKS